MKIAYLVIILRNKTETFLIKCRFHCLAPGIYQPTPSYTFVSFIDHITYDAVVEVLDRTPFDSFT